jgi:hypothetical protein
MSTHFTLDGESFQNLLARAFLAQEYLESQKAQRFTLDHSPKHVITEQPKDAIPPDYIQSLHAIVEVQRLIATDDLDLDGAVALIADRAREVADATGVAIGLLEGDELVYRAGSGSVTTYTGRHVKATLSVSAHNRARGEILRVENTETDARIEAAICRQFGAKALLIVPICYDRDVAGAVEILFGEAHAFKDHEVRTYQLMAGLIAEAKSHAAELARKQALATERAKAQPHPAETTAAASAEGAELPFVRWLAGAVAMVTQGTKALHLHQCRWKTAAVVTVLVMAVWIGYTHRRPASSSVSTVSTSALPRSNASEQVSFARAKLVPANSMSTPQTATALMRGKKTPARTTPHRLRDWDDQVDYVAEDVTVRYFTLKPAVASPKKPIGIVAQPRAQPLPPPAVVDAADKPGIKPISGQSKNCAPGHLGLGRRLVCWLHKVFATPKLPNNSPKDWEPQGFS